MNSTPSRQGRPADLLEPTPGSARKTASSRRRCRTSPGSGCARASRSGSRPGHFPAELAQELGDLGVLGMHLKGYGCAGASATSYGLACLELEAADSAFRSFVSVQGSLSMFSIWAYGSQEQKQEWLPRLASGRAAASG